jgi:hypothetical protein
MVLVLGAPMNARAQLPQAKTQVIDRSRMTRNVDPALIRKLRGDSTPENRMPPAATEVLVQPGQYTATRVAEAPRLEVRRRPLGMTEAPGAKKTDSVLVLPFRWKIETQDNRTMVLRPSLMKEHSLKYSPAEGVFSGSILVGLEDSLAPALRQHLDIAIPLTLVSDGDSIDPDTLRLSFTNQPFVKATVVASVPRDSVRVHVVPSFDPRGTDIWLPVRPSLVFLTPKPTASGFGIETIPLTVSVIGAAIKDSVMVTLATDQGSLQQNRVAIDPGGSATVRLRSAGLGPAHIRATSPGMDAAEATVRYEWPISFLLAALLGGAVGGLAKGATQRRRAAGLRRAVLVGLLIGFVVAVVYFAVEVNLTQFSVKAQFFDEAAVFALALLGGLFGIPLLKAKEAS